MKIDEKEPLLVVVPLSVPQSKKKNFILNLNVYRNAHFFTLNTAKRNFKEAILEQVMQLPALTNIHLEYTLYPKTKRLCDVSNVCCIVDKFFADTLVECGKLPDDNYKYLARITYRIGKVDAANPRMEVRIYNHAY